MKSVRILNQSQNTVLAEEALWAQSYWARLRGFLGRPEPTAGQGLILDPCNSVHMWGMRYALDILFANQDDQVVDFEQGLQPWKLSRRVREATRVVELPVGTLQASHTAIGDQLSFRVVEKG